MARNIRWVVRRAIAEALAEDDDLSGLLITRGWPGEIQEAEFIWLGPSATVGALDVPVFTGPDFEANPVNMNDTFTVQVNIHAGTAGMDTEAAEDRGEQLYLAVERVIRTKPLLASFQGGIPGLQSVKVTEVSIQTANFLEGVRSLVYVTLTCKSRISGGAS